MKTENGAFLKRLARNQVVRCMEHQYPLFHAHRGLLRREALQIGLGAMLLAAFGNSSASAATSDHGPWDRIVRATVNSAGWVDYALISNRFSGDLSGYLRSLADSAAEFPSASAAKAFWLNAYNALCVKTLLDEGLPKEVPHSKVFGKNIFTIKRYRVAGKVRSLDEIEHEILRKRYRDNRIHAAVVCGASSCPRLRAEAYVDNTLDRQLDEECRSWIQTERTKEGTRKNYLDRSRKTFYASKIFDWYAKDFGGNARGIREFLARYATPDDREFLKQPSVKLEFLDYSWRLNSR